MVQGALLLGAAAETEQGGNTEGPAAPVFLTRCTACMQPLYVFNAENENCGEQLGHTVWPSWLTA